MKMKRIFQLSIILFTGINIQAQHTNNLYVPAMSSVIPPSPNAASLGLFGNIPIGCYNGSSDINIPLYEIQDGSQKLPISLCYNSSGVRVGQEASWVGLSWALNAGGCITRECFGGDDFAQTPKFGYYFDTDLDFNMPNNGAMGSWQNNVLWALSGDPQPDIFHFNFGTHSGSMFLQQNTANALLRNCKEYLKPTYDVLKKSWLMVDGNGYKYYFGGSDASRDISTGCYLTEFGEYNISPLPDVRTINEVSNLVTRYPFEAVITAWYLDSIVAPNKDKVIFDYKSENISTAPMSEEEVKMTMTPPPGGSDIVPEIRQNSYTGSKIKQTYLSKITFPEGVITFNTSDRKDIKSENTDGKNAQKLESIIINNNSGEQVKRYNFNYIYLGYEDDPIYCRLLLDKLIEQSTDGKTKQHSFSYNMDDLPSKNSRQIDFWGYFNNSKAPVRFSKSKLDATEEGTLIPSFIRPSDLLGPKTFFFGRDRTPDAESMQHGVLESITYPTGGSTQFVYEPHDFTNQFTICFTEQTVSNEASLNFSENTYGFYTVGSNQSVDFDVNETNEKRINISLKSETATVFPNDSYFMSWGTVNIKKFDLSTNDYTITVASQSLPNLGCNVSNCNNLTLANSANSQLSVVLATGKYRMYIQSDLGKLGPSYHDTPYPYYNNYEVKAYVSSLSPKTTSTGGGLRVKEIYDVTAQGEVSYRKYNYKKNNVSTGQLLTTPVFDTQFDFEQLNKPIYNGWGVITNTATVYNSNYFWAKSTPFLPLEQLFSSSNVFYTDVEEVFGRNGENGKKAYSFNTDNPTNISYNNMYYYDTLYLSPSNAGLPRSITTYDKDGYIQERKSYNYILQNTSTQYSRGLCLRQIYPDFDDKKTLWGQAGYVLLFNPIYPNIRLSYYDLYSEWARLSGDSTLTYFNHGQNNVLHVNTYLYDNVNYQPTVISTSDSRGITVEQRMTYPTGSTDPMYLKSLVNYPVEKSSFKNGTFLEKQRTTYSSKYLSDMLLPEYIYYKRGTSDEEKRIEYVSYDSKGNNLYVTKDDVQKTCYIWSYNYKYPVVEISNATYDQVNGAVNAGFLLSITTAITPTDATILSLGSTLRAALPYALVTTYTYNPLVGTMTKTDSRGVTTTYVYDTFNRLQYVKDKNGNSIQKYDYNYKH
jgi:hypothetical protein